MKKLLLIFILILLSTSIYAVWYNPLSWFTQDEKVIVPKPKPLPVVSNSISVPLQSNPYAVYEIDPAHLVTEYNKSCFTMFPTNQSILSDRISKGGLKLSAEELKVYQKGEVPFKVNGVQVKNQSFTKTEIFCHNLVVGKYSYGFRSTNITIRVNDTGTHNNTFVQIDGYVRLNGTNLARNAVIFDCSTTVSGSCANVNDGTYANGDLWLSTADNDVEQWVFMDFGSNKNISRVRMVGRVNDHWLSAKLQVSLDNSSWTNVTSFTEPDPDYVWWESEAKYQGGGVDHYVHEFDFPTAEGRYFRLFRDIGQGTDTDIRMYELEVYEIVKANGTWDSDLQEINSSVDWEILQLGNIPYNYRNWTRTEVTHNNQGVTTVVAESTSQGAASNLVDGIPDFSTNHWRDCGSGSCEVQVNITLNDTYYIYGFHEGAIGATAVPQSVNVSVSEDNVVFTDVAVDVVYTIAGHTYYWNVTKTKYIKIDYNATANEPIFVEVYALGGKFDIYHTNITIATKSENDADFVDCDFIEWDRCIIGSANGENLTVKAIFNTGNPEFSPMLQFITFNYSSGAADTTPPEITNLENISTQNVTAVVQITCDEGCNASVTWGTATSHTDAGDTVNISFSTALKVNISNFLNNTKVNFNVTGWCDSSGNCNTTGKNFTFFSTQNPPEVQNLSVPRIFNATNTTTTNITAVIQAVFNESANMSGTYGTGTSLTDAGNFSNSTYALSLNANLSNFENNTRINVNITEWCDSSANCNTTGFNFTFFSTQNAPDLTPPSLTALTNISTTNISAVLQATCDEECNITGTCGTATSLTDAVNFTNTSFNLNPNANISNFVNNTRINCNVTNWCDAPGNCNQSGFNFTFFSTQNTIPPPPSAAFCRRSGFANNSMRIAIGILQPLCSVDCNGNWDCLGFGKFTSLNITNDATITGDLTVEGNITGNIHHAQMWNYTSNVSAWTFVIDAEGVYFNMTGLTPDNLNGFSFTDGGPDGGGTYFTAQVAGLYKADLDFSFEGTVNKRLYGFSLAKNHLPANSRQCYQRRWVSNQAVVGSLTISCFVELAIGDDIVIQIEAEGGTGNIEIHAVNLNLIRIGD